MNNKYKLFPEVAGQLGEETILDNAFHPPIASQLHYKFDGWLGDDIIESFPCFICSEKLTICLKKSNLTGFTFQNCQISKSQQFLDLYPKRELPTFYRFMVGPDQNNDFFLMPNASLVVSQNALDFLKSFQILNCDIEDFID